MHILTINCGSSTLKFHMLDLSHEGNAVITARRLARGLVALNGADAVIFGGGIGENAPEVRKRIRDDMDWCGLILDNDRNMTDCWNRGTDQRGRCSCSRIRRHGR